LLKYIHIILKDDIIIGRAN